ncbi:hypothetical protein OH687_10620 [Burkholderia anthina]|nr:hypothetical protein OH687_10620 [Burkholderia anthina]
MQVSGFRFPHPASLDAGRFLVLYAERSDLLAREIHTGASA